MFGLQLMLIDAENDRRVEVVTAGVGEQDFFRAGGEMRFAVFTVAIYAGTVKHQIHTQFTPR